jgi:hypothetical protein
MLSYLKSPISLENLEKERFTHKQLLAKLSLLSTTHKVKLLSEIPKPAENHDYMCHTYAASYALQWLYANNLISAKPFPVRSRDTQDKFNTKISKKTHNTKQSFVSMRFIAKTKGLNAAGELLNGTELCALINSCKEIDPNQNYSAETLQVYDKKEYINTLINAVDKNTTPIVVFDSAHPVGFLKGQQEHATLIVGYVQSKDKTYFIAIGGSGYWLTSSDTLFASTSQLEPRYYNKALFKYEDTGQKDFAEERKKHEEILEKYKDADAIKVSHAGVKNWFPVTKISSQLPNISNQAEVMNGGLPKECQRKIVTRQNTQGWKNTIVIIRPDNKDSIYDKKHVHSCTI